MDYIALQRLDDLFFEADQLIKEQRYTEAMTTLEAILIEAPDYGKAYNHLGWLMETRYKNYNKAEEYYRKCLALTPEYTPVYLNLSITLSTLGKFAEQGELLRSALMVPGIEKAVIQNELGIMHELLGDFDVAVDHYKLAIMLTLAETNVDLYYASVERCRKKQRLLKNI